MRIIILLSILIIIPAVVHAQNDWRNLRWGMTHEEVVYNQPSAFSITENHNRQGEYYDIFARIENVGIAGVMFRADLLFDSEKLLTGVIMKTYGPRNVLSQGYTQIVNELIDRHGQPTSFRPIVNRNSIYNWSLSATDISLSYTEIVKGDVDIALGYYQIATFKRKSIDVVRLDKVLVLPRSIATDQPLAVQPQTVQPQTVLTQPEPISIVPTKSDAKNRKTKIFGEISMQVSSDLKSDGFKSVGFGLGGYGYNHSKKWIPFYMNAYFNSGRMEENGFDVGTSEVYTLKLRNNAIGTRIGFGIPKINTVIFGLVETSKSVVDGRSSTYSETYVSDGYKTSFGGGLRFFINPNRSSVSFGIEYSELRSLGVSLGVTF